MLILSMSIVIGILLMAMLFFLTARDWVEKRKRTEEAKLTEADETAGCPEGFVERIVSRDDWEFVHKTGSPGLENLFRKERKDVALTWVRETASGIREIMKQHSAYARQSADLDAGTEAKIMFLYGELRVLCGALTLLIHIAGPMHARGLAGYASKLSQRMGETQRALQAVAKRPEEVYEMGSR
ncbi:MAG TPA: hypothetical protein VGI16_16075 [Candidatus Acidoferrum sp.]|jgi:hypothetical protein